MNESKHDLSNNVDEASKVFAKYGDYIRAVIRYKIKDETLVEDLSQDVFLTLVKNPIPGDVKNIRGFLYRIIFCDISDAIRKIERHRTKLEIYAEYRKNQPTNKFSSKNEVEIIEKLPHAIKNQLTQTEAQAINLRYNENCDINETAKKMGVKPRSVSRYVSVGISKLKNVFSEKGA